MCYERLIREFNFYEDIQDARIAYIYIYMPSLRL